MARVGHHEKRHRQSDSDIGLAGVDHLVHLPRARPARVPAILAIEVGSCTGLLFGHWIIGAALGLALWFLRRIVGRRSA